MKENLTRSRNWGIALGVLLMTTACSSNPLSQINPFAGKDNDTAEENVAEQDDRIPVLALENRIQADDSLSGLQVQLPPPYVNASWTQPGGDADHTMHHLGASLNLERLWKVKVTKDAGKRSPLIAPPVVADGTIFVIDAKTTVSAYDANTGSKKWRVDLAPDMKSAKRKWYHIARSEKAAENGFGSGVAYDSGRVFLTSGFGFVASLDAETGDLLWKHETTSPVRTPPTAANGSVYVLTNSNEFFALDQQSGEVQWDYQSFEESARFLSATSAAASDEVIIAPFSSGEVTALKADNGQMLWTETVARSSRMTALSNLNDIAGSPVIDRGIVFAISHAGQMSAIDLRSGQTIWEVPVSGLQTPWVSGDFIFLISVENELICLERKSGKTLWVQSLPKYQNEKKKKKRITWSGPVLAGGKVIVTSSRGEILLADPQTGEETLRKKIGKGSGITPIIADEKIYILSTKGQLTAFK